MPIIPTEKKLAPHNSTQVSDGSPISCLLRCATDLKVSFSVTIAVMGEAKKVHRLHLLTILLCPFVGEATELNEFSLRGFEFEREFV